MFSLVEGLEIYKVPSGEGVSLYRVPPGVDSKDIISGCFHVEKVVQVFIEAHPVEWQKMAVLLTSFSCFHVGGGDSRKPLEEAVR